MPWCLLSLFPVLCILLSLFPAALVPAVPLLHVTVRPLQELEVQHTATVLDDAAGFLAAIGQLTALTSLAAGSNQLSDLPAAWSGLKRLKVGFCPTRVTCLQIHCGSCYALPNSSLYQGACDIQYPPS